MCEQLSDIFHFDESKPNFNDLSKENGFTHWSARKLMSWLGYKNWTSFHKSIQKAMSACTTLGIKIFDNFMETTHNKEDDYKLSRFACYLVAMNGDPKIPEVANAQAYFITMTEAFQRHIQETKEFERMHVRDEISDREKTLSSTAQKAGVDNYALFQNAGYLGMYNMNLGTLRQQKNIPNKRSPLDFMGKEELAANLFRVTQTEAKIRNKSIMGQKPAEKTAREVGEKVRQTMIEISGTAPETLPPHEDIKKVKGTIKSTQKEFKKLDSKNQGNTPQ